MVEEPTEQEAPATDPAPVSRQPRIKLLGDFLMDATAKAQSWNPHAALVSIRISDFTDANALANQGTIRFEFAVAKGGTFGANPPVGTQRLWLTFSAGKWASKPGSGATTARAVSDPTCPLEVALKIARGAGLKETALNVRYGVTAKHGKAVWTLGAGRNQRVVDGFSCAVVVR